MHISYSHTRTIRHWKNSIWTLRTSLNEKLYGPVDVTQKTVTVIEEADVQV